MNPAAGTLKMIGMPQTPVQTPAPAGGDWDLSFHNLLGIINPLQHLPVVGTLYRALTGDTIGMPEKIAGDALYGGLWGAVSGVADAAFTAVTGKDFGGTVLAMLTGDDDATPVAVATNTAAPPAPASDGNVAALTAALAQKGVEGDLAQRAVLAYQKSQSLSGPVLAAVR